VGLGPVPFVLIPVIAPPHVSRHLFGWVIEVNLKSRRRRRHSHLLACLHTVRCLSLVRIWYKFTPSTLGVANYFVGQTFLPLRDFLSGGDATKEGRVFFAFALALALSMGTFSRVHLRRDT
jgi:hypothetical protein